MDLNIRHFVVGLKVTEVVIITWQKLTMMPIITTATIGSRQGMGRSLLHALTVSTTAMRILTAISVTTLAVSVAA